MEDPPNRKVWFSITPLSCGWRKQWKHVAKHAYLVSVFEKKGKRLYLLPWIARSAEQRAALQELQLKENSTTMADWDTVDNEIGLEGILHGTETLPYSHGGEDIDQLGQAILGDLWERFVSLSLAL